MSVEAITFVWQTSKVQSTRLLMMLALADFADDLGECWPGIEALAQKVRVKVRNAQTILKKLVETGAIEIEYNNGVPTKTGRTNRYRLVGFVEWFKKLKAIRQEVQSAAPLKTKGVQNSVKRGANLRQQEVQSAAPDPSLEPSKEPKDTSLTGSAPPGDKSAGISVTSTDPGSAATSQGEKPQAENSSTPQAKAAPPSQELKSPPPVPAGSPTDPTFSADTREALAALCKKDLSIKAHDKAIRATLGSIRPTGPVTRDKLDTFRCNWYKLDFRGQKGQAPEPRQVVDKWAEYTTLACQEGNGNGRHELLSKSGHQTPGVAGRPATGGSTHGSGNVRDALAFVERNRLPDDGL